MLKSEKGAYIRRLEEMFSSSSAVLLLQNLCMDVACTTKMRRELRVNGATMIFAKNTFARVALKSTNLNFLQDKFSGSVVLVFSSDITGMIKVVSSLAEKSRKFSVLGATSDSTYLAGSEVAYIATLPSLHELRVKITMLLNAPVMRLNNAIQGSGKKLTFLLSAHNNKSNS